MSLGKILKKFLESSLNKKYSFHIIKFSIKSKGYILIIWQIQVENLLEVLHINILSAEVITYKALNLELENLISFSMLICICTIQHRKGEQFHELTATVIICSNSDIDD